MKKIELNKIKIFIYFINNLKLGNEAQIFFINLQFIYY